MPERGARRGGRSGSTRTARIETSSGGVVYRWFNGEPRFLLIRDPYRNWGLPKGHIEGGESPEEAALREVAEESGLVELAVVTQLPTIDWHFRDRVTLIHQSRHLFLLESPAGEPVPQHDEGITACTWRSIDDALRIVSYANAREVLRTAGRHLGELPQQAG